MSNPSNEWDKGGIYYPGWSDLVNQNPSLAERPLPDLISRCRPELVQYRGISELSTDKINLQYNEIKMPEDKDEIALILIKGFIPRSPVIDELTLFGILPKLQETCWWVTEINKFSYNCYGFCQGRLQVYYNLINGRPLQENLGKALVVNEDRGAAFSFYEGLGLVYKETTKPSDKSMIAFYQNGHVAWKSDYYYSGAKLWESKLGSYSKYSSVRILTSLAAAEQGEYGNVVGFFELK